MFLLNRLVVYSLPTAMSYLTGNHTMDLLYLLKENFKNLLSDLLIPGRSFENLSYLSICLLSQRLRIRRIRSNVLRGIESYFTYTKVSAVASQYILWSGSLWYPVRSSMLKNRRFYSLVISKLMPAFSTVQVGTVRHNQTYPGIIQAYSGIFRTLCYPDILKTVVCPEPWHIENQKHIQNPGIFTTMVHSEPRYTQNACIFKIWGIFKTLSQIYNEALIIFINYNYFRKTCRVEISILR